MHYLNELYPVVAQCSSSDPLVCYDPQLINVNFVNPIHRLMIWFSIFKSINVCHAIKFIENLWCETQNDNKSNQFNDAFLY